MISSSLLLILSLFRKKRVHINIKKDLPTLFFLGIAGYSVAQGLQYVGLSYLPAVTVTFLLNFTPVLVLLFGIVCLHETPTSLQVVGLTFALFGAFLFFSVPLSGVEVFGILMTLLSSTGWAAYMVFSRRLLKLERLNPLNLTAISMFFGAITLLGSALVIDGPVSISLPEVGIILWLSLVNTALAFVLWNHALEQMKAFELSILQNTMLIQIGILAWIFLGENFSMLKITAMGIVFVGIIIVQLGKTKSKSLEHRDQSKTMS
jgi:drug/metabolite transporter (DMT)-like permease